MTILLLSLIASLFALSAIIIRQLNQIARGSNKYNHWWKVPDRDSVCETFGIWVATVLLIHVWYRVTALFRGRIPKYCALAVCLILALTAITACNTTQQRNSYNTIASVEATANAAYDSYCQLVISGAVSTNYVPQVSEKFNQLQAACTLAAATTQAGTNAVAPVQLTAELTDLSNLISSFQTTTNK